ncbi:MAG: flagellar protein FlgN [Acidobacteriia bacterium]|nr:flagellar protein FlgN [Terriglobia bacterium]
MADIDTYLPELSALIEQRLELLRSLAESLEVSQVALVGNDAEAIARGAAHQAELCRQWGLLEEQLRKAKRPSNPSSETGHGGSLDREYSAHLQAEWDELGTRIRYLTRVHWSLLRHMQRSLAVLSRVVESCAPTYAAPGPGLSRPEAGAGAGE